VLHDITRFPKHGAKAAGVPESKNCAVIQDKIDVIMFARMRGLSDGDEPQATLHAQVQDEDAFARVEQEVFCATRDLGDTDAADLESQIARNRPAQHGISHCGADNATTFNVGCNASTDNFYFG